LSRLPVSNFIKKLHFAEQFLQAINITKCGSWLAGGTVRIGGNGGGLDTEIQRSPFFVHQAGSLLILPSLQQRRSSMKEAAAGAPVTRSA
jgi:hypothetical protein